MRLSNVLMALPLVKGKKQLWPLDAVLMCHLPTATFTNMFMGFLISLCFSSLPRRVCALSSCLCSFACLPIFLAFPSLVPACPYVSSSCALRVLYLSPTCPLFAPCSPCSACTLLTLCPACPLLSPHVPYLSPLCPLLASLFSARSHRCSTFFTPCCLLRIALRIWIPFCMLIHVRFLYLPSSFAPIAAHICQYAFRSISSDTMPSVGFACAALLLLSFSLA